jgi:hypothetical protein
MATEKKMEFPRINFVALLAGAMFLVSIFLYWWGLDTTGSIAGSTISDSLRWSLWSGPSTTSVSSAQSFQTLVTYSPVIGILTIASAVLVLVGTIPKAHRLLAGGIILSMLTPITYALLVNYAVSNGCGGSSNCISGPFGTETTNAGIVSLTRTWGFQPGFYLEIVGAILSILAVAFHQTFLKVKAP